MHVLCEVVECWKADRPLPADNLGDKTFWGGKKIGGWKDDRRGMDEVSPWQQVDECFPVWAQCQAISQYVALPMPTPPKLPPLHSTLTHSTFKQSMITHNTFQTQYIQIHSAFIRYTHSTLTQGEGGGRSTCSAILSGLVRWSIIFTKRKLSSKFDSTYI